jgi:RNA polymerase sigma-70 factor (ECF subfamily)
MSDSRAHPGEELSGVIAQLQSDLREIAARQLRHERPGHTLQPTALVNEAYLRLAGQRNLRDAGRTTVIAAAAQTIRRVLVDHARARQAEKRNGEHLRVTLSGVDIAASAGPDVEFEVVALHDALEALARHDGRMAQVVELRFFGGLTVDETAGVLGVSPRTVADDWVFAKAWLRRQMDGQK